MPIIKGKLVPKSATVSAQPKSEEKPSPRASAPRQQPKEEKTNPCAPEAEAGVLGCLLQNASAIPELAGQITPAYFFNPINADIFRSLVAMWEAGKGLDLVTFTQYLNDRKMLDKLGGAHYVTSLFTSIIGPEHLPWYVDILREKFLRREMIRAGSALSRSGYVEGEDLEQLLQTAKRSLIQITDAHNVNILRDGADCLNGHRPEIPAELVRRILHQGSKMIVGGTSKGRKTMALIDLAVSIATGSDWWGFHTKQGPVCYINFEIQDAFFWYRVDEICKAKAVTLDPGMFYAWNLRGQANAMERLTEDLLSVLQSKPFVLDVIDPIYKALGQRDENKAGDVASMLNELEKIAVETDAAIAFGAHYSKGNQILKEHVDRIGGSGVFARDPDSILTMTAHEEEECFTVESTLRNFRPLAPFVLRWEWPMFRRDDELDAAQLKGSNAGQFKQAFTADMLMDHLSIAVGIKTTDLRKLVDQKNGMSKSTFYNLKAEILRKKMAVERDGELFRWTE